MNLFLESSFPLSSFLLSIICILFLLFHVITLFFIVSLLHNKAASPREIGKAVYVQVLLGFGALMIIAGIFPLLLSLFGASKLSTPSLTTYLLFVGSGIAFLIMLSKRTCSKVDQEVAAIARSMYHCTFFIFGALTTFFGVTFFIAEGIKTMALENMYQPIQWWVIPVTFVILGVGTLISFQSAAEGKFQILCRK